LTDQVHFAVNDHELNPVLLLHKAFPGLLITCQMVSVASRVWLQPGMGHFRRAVGAADLVRKLVSVGVVSGG
jgi:hypothetical protein